MDLAWLIFLIPALAGLVSYGYPKLWLVALLGAVTDVVILLLAGKFGWITAPPAFTWLSVDGLQVECRLRGDPASWDRALLLVVGAVFFLVGREQKGEMRRWDAPVWSLLLASGLAAVLLEPGLFWFAQVSLLVGWVAVLIPVESGLVHRIFNQLSLPQLFLLIGLALSAAGYPTHDWLWLMVLGAGGWLGLVPWQSAWRAGGDRDGLGLYVGIGWPVGFSLLFGLAPQIQADPLAGQLLYILGGLTFLVNSVPLLRYGFRPMDLAMNQAGLNVFMLSLGGPGRVELGAYIITVDVLVFAAAALFQADRLTAMDQPPQEKPSVLSRLFQGEVPRSGLSWWDGWLVDGLVIRGSVMQFLIVGELARLWQCGSVMVYLFLSLSGGALLYFGFLLPK